MLALLDADILTYECAFAGQDKETGEVHSFEYVSQLLEDKIYMIKQGAGADEAKLFLTGSGNFREAIAVTKPYKGTRKEEKPWHYDNLRAYILSLPNSVLTQGIEADDAMCIEQTRRLEAKDTIICSRDKDLRICRGWHYGWEHGAQPEFFPEFVSDIGRIDLEIKGTPEKPRKEIKGTGLKFFYSQLITGDKTDNIPGLPKGGPVLAYDLLAHLDTEEALYEAVRSVYSDKLGEGYATYLLEQARLLWMIQELDENNNPIMWNPPIDSTSVPPIG